MQHVYPFDYKVSELPRYWCNFSIPFLDFFAWLGWATDLKTVSDEMIRKRVLRTGDGTHRYAPKKLSDSNNNEFEKGERVDTLWGWGECLILNETAEASRTLSVLSADDTDMDEEEKKEVTIINPSRRPSHEKSQWRKLFLCSKIKLAEMKKKIKNYEISKAFCDFSLVAGLFLWNLLVFESRRFIFL